ncbi:hypothetical protein V6N12_019237 [Hibiscus sabdariffa]|uniref:Uncharacterized protein n=1 Tax=Hibiscus sabdariffa TaxID=183260 RepID=A0ABR2C8J8_9ROSI
MALDGRLCGGCSMAGCLALPLELLAPVDSAVDSALDPPARATGATALASSSDPHVPNEIAPMVQSDPAAPKLATAVVQAGSAVPSAAVPGVRAGSAAPSTTAPAVRKGPAVPTTAAPMVRKS